MEPIFDNISVDHIFVSCFHLRDLLFDFTLEDKIKLVRLIVLLVFTTIILIFLHNFAHIHFQSREL